MRPFFAVASEGAHIILRQQSASLFFSDANSSDNLLISGKLIKTFYAVVRIKRGEIISLSSSQEEDYILTEFLFFRHMQESQCCVAALWTGPQFCFLFVQLSLYCSSIQTCNSLCKYSDNLTCWCDVISHLCVIVTAAICQFRTQSNSSRSPRHPKCFIQNNCF